MNPSVPHEAKMTDEQRKAVRRIQTIIKSSFHRGMLSVVFKGTDAKFHIQVVNNCTSNGESIDLATRTLQEVQVAEAGIISTLSPIQKRIIVQ